MIAIARLAVAVGLLGLLPFVAGAAAVLLWPERQAQMMELFYLYSAGILVFMAGVYWPIGLQLQQHCYPVSPVVVMALSQAFFVTAGVAVLLPMTIQAVLFPLAYLLLYLVDAVWMKSFWPAWYLRLRLALTAVAMATQLAVGIVLL
ncbi:DUF3429 domain-containing protein [Marinobacter sp. CA1]|uniref:DUF3429 domain-containing protein n=1 Tax=Marinobacter sp. CA1 TaxID=2817656 RepID=UPI001D06ADD0|nr:DUF3429 domain-containing protein [Marinobacter sp. CA1]MCG8518632.1 DUF3429 domain-containing protein [Pseudomonadales bacterium]UDL04874.1 DUF3429 domain-containing protein [Marinobacter sp. CA1]